MNIRSGQVRVGRLRTERVRNLFLVLCASASVWLLSSCEVGPDYKRPAQHMPTTFKAATTQQASTQPAVAHLEQDWWKLFGDAELNRLEERAVVANPGLQAAMQRVEEARAAAGIAKSEFYPLITFDPSFERSRTPANPNNNNGNNFSLRARTSNNIQVPFDLSYEVDIWGRVRRNYEASRATAFASADDYEVVLQTLEADVASDYFALRLYDAQIEIYDKTVQSYKNQLRLTQQQKKAGLVGQTDVAQAEAELQATYTEQIEAMRNRDDEEHAIATLLGIPASEFSIAHGQYTNTPPIIPVGLPATLLCRRPDVAEAEQNLVTANAQVGVAIATALPKLTLTGSAGFESFNVKDTFNWEQRAWSFGPSISAPIFEGGLLKYGIEEAKAKYAELLATYRGSVLQAIQDVEDSLVDLHRRADEASAQEAAVRASQEYLRLSDVQYRQGLVSYLQIIDADRTLLTNQLAAAQILNGRLTSTVLLIKALGGGWESRQATTQANVP